MRRKHPQNGPSLSKAPQKKQKPLDDKALAALQARQKAAEEEARQKAASGRRFGAAVRENGGTIPIRGGNAEAFWSKIRRDDEEAASAAGKKGVAPRAETAIPREDGETDDEYHARSSALRRLLSEKRPAGRRG